MRKITTLVALLLLFGSISYAQQDAMFTKYMFNSLVFNPAYAGAKDHASIGLLHRTQWWGIDGAPTTQTLTAHTPLRNDRVGVGMTLYNDAIGPTNTLGANLAYSYRIPIGQKGKLAIGLQGGIVNWRADWTRLNLPDNVDPAFDEGNVNMWLPNFGTGIYYYTPNFYVGAASPHLIEYDRREDIETEIWARGYRHYFFMIGGAIPIKGDALVFKPSLLIKNVGLDKTLSKDEAFKNIGAPTSFDIDLSVLFFQSLWLGVAYRSAIEDFSQTSSNDSFDIWLSYYLRNGLRIGAAFDYTLTKLRQPAGGSFEVMLGYEFNFEAQRTVTPRYF